MSKMIGIDLGTTNSVASDIRQKAPRVVDNQDSEPLTPSVVHLTEHGEWIVGKTAKKSAGISVEDARSTVFSIKRYMGVDFENPVCAEDIKNSPYEVQKAPNGEVEVILRGRRFSPPEISAFILESVKKSAESTLDEEISHAVITVPAYFGSRQKDATRLAGQLAGLNVLRIIPEPTAAALAYGVASESDEPKTVLVYDLGGGTFDVTVMFIGAGVFEDQGKSGDMHLGGDNFDYRIVDWLFEQIRIQHGIDFRNTPNNQVKFQLKQAAEEAKVALSQATRVPIVIPALTKIDGKILTIECELKRDDFNGMIKPLVDRSMDLVYEAIKLARTTPDEIDAILLVGGSTRVKLVEETVRSIFGDKVIRGGVNPMYCVAQGAAIETMLVKEVSTEVDESIIQCQCGTLNLKSRAECRNCGEKLDGGVISGLGKKPKAPPTITCPKCGKENPMDLEKCKHCGTAFMEIKGKPPVVIHTTPHPIGVQVEGDKLEIIIPEAEPYPMDMPKTRLLKTTYDGQDLVRLPVYEGRDPVASKNQLLGEAQGKLEAGLPEGTNVEVALSIDSDGIIYINASLPDRPGSVIKASMKMQRDTETNVAAEKESESEKDIGTIEPEEGSGTSAAWKNQAQTLLFQASAVKDEGQGVVDPPDLDRIVQMGAELLTAIKDDDQTKGERIMSELEPLVNKYGIFFILAIMRVILQNPDISTSIPNNLRKEFDSLAEQLESLIKKADSAKQQGDLELMVKSIGQGQSIVERIMQIMEEAGKLAGEDLLSGLLRGTADSN